MIKKIALARLNFGLENAVILGEDSYTLALAPVISRQEYVQRVRAINEISRKHRSFRIASIAPLAGIVPIIIISILLFLSITNSRPFNSVQENNLRFAIGSIMMIVLIPLLILVSCLMCNQHCDFSGQWRSKALDSQPRFQWRRMAGIG
jgi:hypothetical protein